jgi:hypothetical protein
MKYTVEYFGTKQAVIDGYADDTEEWDDEDVNEEELINVGAQWCNRGYGIAVAIFKDGKLLWGSDEWHSILNEL